MAIEPIGFEAWLRTARLDPYGPEPTSPAERAWFRSLRVALVGEEAVREHDAVRALLDRLEGD